jgi:hypothetical protein
LACIGKHLDEIFQITGRLGDRGIGKWYRSRFIAACNYAELLEGRSAGWERSGHVEGRISGRHQLQLSGKTCAGRNSLPARGGKLAAYFKFDRHDAR